MAKLRKPSYPFTMVPNALIGDKRLSWKAKGIYALLFSKPDDWEYIETPLIEQGADGRDSFRAGLRELADTGWLTKRQVQSADGKFSSIEWHLSVDGSAVDGKPVDGKSDTTNTDITNTDLTNKPLTPLRASGKKEKRDANAPTSLSQFLETNAGSMPREWGEWAANEFRWDAERIRFEWADFSDYWNSGNAVGGGRKKDWPATWRSFCRRVSGLKGRGVRTADQSAGRGGQGGYDVVASASRKALDELYGKRPSGYDGSYPAGTADACPFGDGEEAPLSVPLDVHPNALPCSATAGSAAGSGEDRHAGTAIQEAVQ